MDIFFPWRLKIKIAFNLFDDFFPKIYEACGQIFDKLNKVTTANQSFAIAFLACPLQENSKKLGLASNGIS